MMMMRCPTAKSVLDDYDRVPIDAPEFPDVRKFVSASRKCVYINTAASPFARVVRLSFDDRDLFRHVR